MGLVLLYDLTIRSKRSFQIKNVKYLLKCHSQSFAMCYRHISKLGLAFYCWDWFCSMTFQSGQKGHFKSKMLNIFLSIIARALQCVTDIYLFQRHIATWGLIRKPYHSYSFLMYYRHIAKLHLAFLNILYTKIKY